MLPRWYRKQLYENKLRGILYNDFSDIRDVRAAKLAIKQKLDEDDRKARNSLLRQASKYRNML